MLHKRILELYGALLTRQTITPRMIKRVSNIKGRMGIRVALGLTMLKNATNPNDQVLRALVIQLFEKGEYHDLSTK